MNDTSNKPEIETQSNFAETLALTHAAMVLAAQTYPMGHGRGNDVKEFLFMRAKEFRHYVKLAGEFPESFEAVTGNNVSLLLANSARAGRYVRSLVRIHAGQPVSRWEIERVLRGINASISPYQMLNQPCKWGHTKSNQTGDAECIVRVLKILYDCGMVTSYHYKIADRSNLRDRVVINHLNPAIIQILNVVAKAKPLFVPKTETETEE